MNQLEHEILNKPLNDEFASSLNIQSLEEDTAPSFATHSEISKRRLETASTEYPNLAEHRRSVAAKKAGHSKSTDLETLELEGEAHHDTLALDLCFLLFIMLALGQFMKSVAEVTGLPYTSLITVAGVVLGICSVRYADAWGRYGKAIVAYSDFPPHLLLLVFLPPLIFESAFNSDWHIFKVELWQILVMAGPMLIASTYLTAVMMTYVFGYTGEFTWEASLMFGSIVSATDPVAVVALLKELGASKRLATMIEGESLLNDGTAMVVFLVLIDLVEGNTLTGGEIIGMFVRLSAGGVILGLLGGVLLAAVLARVHNDAVREMNATIVVAYLLFYVAESTPLHVSGILAIVALGLYMTTSGKTKISAESMHTVHGIWGYVGFVAETVIFIVSGVIMGERASTSNTITYIDYLKLLGVYVGLHFIRFFTIFVSWPLLRRIGYGMSFAQVVLCSYAGLRGAVGLSLALMVAGSTKIPRHVQDIVLLHVAGVALLTLLINASTTGAVVRYLGLAKSSDLKQNMLISVTHSIHKNIDETVDKLQEDEGHHWCSVDWDELRQSCRLTDLQESLKKYQHIQITGGSADNTRSMRLRNVNEKIKNQQIIKGINVDDQEKQTYDAALQKSGPAKSDQKMGKVGSSDNCDPIMVEELFTELRHKYITILKSLYWEYFEEGQCQAESVRVLIESADRALDHEDQPLEDWKFINTYIVSDGWYLRALQALSGTPLLGAIFHRLLFSHFAVAWDIIVTFVDCHDEASAMLRKVIENEAFVDKIVGESKDQRELAEAYQHGAIDGLFPELAAQLQLRRAQYYVLVHEYHYVEGLLHKGQIEEKDVARFKAEIDKKILALQRSGLELQTVDPVEEFLTLTGHGGLLAIFDRQDLEKALGQNPAAEDFTEPEQAIKNVGKVLYVARGACVEKKGAYKDTSVMELKCGHGHMAYLQNLQPYGPEAEFQQMSEVYAHSAGYASVVALEVAHLKQVLDNDPEKLLKYWQHLAYRMIILNNKQLPQITPMTSEDVKRLARMCTVKIYKNGDKADVAGGAILIRGGLQVQSDQLPSGYPNKLSGVGYLPPQKGDAEIMAAAESEDYTVVLHFPAALRARVVAAGGTVDAGMLPTAHRKRFLKRGTLYDEDHAYQAPDAAKDDAEAKPYATAAKEGKIGAEALGPPQSASNSDGGEFDKSQGDTIKGNGIN